MVGLVVPVMKNFKGFTRLMASVDIPITPYVINNWDHNNGVAAGWNAGIKWGFQEDYLIICNDDVVLYPGTLTKLIVCLMRNALKNPVDLVSVVASDTGQTGYIDYEFPDFACFAISPKPFVEKFGWFDEKFTPAYFEDNDMVYRIKVGGGRQGLCLDARVEHDGSATQYMDRENPVVNSDLFEANRAYFKAKWGGLPHEEVYTTPHNQPNLTIKDW